MAECVPESGRAGWPRGAGTPSLHVVLGQPEQRTRRGESASAADGGLADRLAADLDGTFEDLVRVYQDRLFSFALRLTRSREDAEESAQDAFVRAYRALCTYPAERIRGIALRPWLYQITLNVVRNRMRGKKLRLVSLDGGSGDGRASWDPADDPAERPDALYETSRRRVDMETLVRSLPERYRAPLILRYVEGLSLEEVARILKQPVGTAKSNVHRGVNALREALTESRRTEGVRR
jgi:RNA polymerase sigma-70 factor (ECF subfamily)